MEENEDEEEEFEDGAVCRKELDDVEGVVAEVKNLIIGEVMIKVGRQEWSNLKMNLWFLVGNFLL